MLFTTTFSLNAETVIKIGKLTHPELKPEDVLGHATVIVNGWITYIVQEKLKEVLSADTAGN